jgi:hypothetical protein
VLPPVKIVYWLLQHQRWPRCAMRQVKVRSCTAVKVICVSVWLWQNVYQGCVTLSLLVQR